MGNRELGAPVVTAYLGVFWIAVGCAAAFATTNTAPNLPQVAWTEEAPTTTTKLEVEITREAQDADGDEVTYLYQWRRNGEIQPGWKAPTLPNKQTTYGDEFELAVIPDDGTAAGGYLCSLPWRECAGESAAKLSIKIGNAPPRARIGYLKANGEEFEGEIIRSRDAVHLDLRCFDPDLRDEELRARASGADIDEEDGDKEEPCTFQASWYRGEEPITDERTPNHKGLFLPANLTRGGDVWRVRVVANDGMDDGDPVDSGVVIAR